MMNDRVKNTDVFLLFFLVMLQLCHENIEK